jgi:ubiquinone/menaquinone biosynthesis C-methylase UbiE
VLGDNFQNGAQFMQTSVNLVCPKCKIVLSEFDQSLKCLTCKLDFRIVNDIPRFVPSSNYANSFGLQWNNFSKTQFDSQTIKRSQLRFENETGWSDQSIKGKIVLDAGCGSGRFSDVAITKEVRLVAVDYSNAVDAAKSNLKKGDLCILQADLAQLPLEDCGIDYIYCIGVLQHTRNPSEIVTELLRCLRIGGEVTFTFYENSSWHVRLYSKYLVRPFTKRIPKDVLLRYIRNSSVFWFPITSFLFKLPAPFSRIFRFVIPIANYVEFNYVNEESAREEAVLDTFDMLSPEYDVPIKRDTFKSWVDASSVKVEYLHVNPKQGTVKLKKLSHIPEIQRF